MIRPLVAALSLALFAASAHSAEWSLVNVIETPADTPDALRTGIRTGEIGGANINRFGFYSDLAYDRNAGHWVALSDRGPGGGVLDYATRLQRITIPVDLATGIIGQPSIDRTILFKDAEGRLLNGLNPYLLNGDKSQLGASFDPEGLALGRLGSVYVADEYGPALHEFDRSGQLRRTFTMPANLRPREASGLSNYVDGRPTITSGRQDNRGFEGLALNASRNKLYAVMQDPLVNEGSSNDGRRSRNVRIVEFDVASGLSTAQYVYRLEDRATINAIDPSTADDFSSTNQGRSIGLSAITALSDSEFLVLERDNRGYGVEETGTPLHKRIYRINLAGATNVQDIPLAGSDSLPVGVTAVQKVLEVDLLAALKSGGHAIPEKIEGMAIGPKLADGRTLVLIGTDNDYSVTQSGSGEQFEVCLDRTTGVRAQVPLDTACPEGLSLIPGVLMGFAVDFSR